MTKISKTHHVTKKGVVKKNPIKDNYGVFAYRLDGDNENFHYEYHNTKDEAIKSAKIMLTDRQFDEDYFVEVWKKSPDGLWGNTGKPIFYGEMKFDIELYRLYVTPGNNVDEEYFDTVHTIEEANKFLKRYNGYASYKGKQIGSHWGDIQLIDAKKVK